MFVRILYEPRQGTWYSPLTSKNRSAGRFIWRLFTIMVRVAEPPVEPNGVHILHVRTHSRPHTQRGEIIELPDGSLKVRPPGQRSTHRQDEFLTATFRTRVRISSRKLSGGASSFSTKVAEKRNLTTRATVNQDGPTSARPKLGQTKRPALHPPHMTSQLYQRLLPARVLAVAAVPTATDKIVSCLALA